MKAISLKFCFAVVFAILPVSALSAQNPKAVYFDRQEIAIPDFPADGFILDIGGGGEGVVGQLKGNQVVSIDPNNVNAAEMIKKLKH